MSNRGRGSKEEQQKAYDKYREAIESRKANFPCPVCGRHYTTAASAMACHPEE